jgi:GT2 family glycosyltransferase
LLDTIRRISTEYGLKVDKAYLVGVFPITFRTRSDVAIAMAAHDSYGEPHVDNYGFSSFAWIKTPLNRHHDTREVFFLRRATFFTKKQALISVDGFDRDFFLGYEEIDPSWRL